MKISMQSFFGAVHSWSIVQQELCRSFKKIGHDVFVLSTDGISHCPHDLKENIVGYIENNKLFGRQLQDISNNFDMQISYTCPKNYKAYLSNGNKNRFGIWTYEWLAQNPKTGSLPVGFAKAYKDCDRILAPSQFSKQIFVESGVPENHITVMPHGININEINKAISYKLKTNKSIKLLMNIAQVHQRKNLSGAFDAIGKAFSSKDDICIVIKVQDRPPTQPFELSFSNIFNSFKKKYRNHCEFEIIKEFVPNIYSLYKACDIFMSNSFSEGFGMIALEAKAIGLITIAPNYGGFKDFLDNKNSILIDGKEVPTPPSHLYWQQRPGLKHFQPDNDDCAAKLKHAYNNIATLKQSLSFDREQILQDYNWDVIADRILKLTK